MDKALDKDYSVDVRNVVSLDVFWRGREVRCGSEKPVRLMFKTNIKWNLYFKLLVILRGVCNEHTIIGR